MAKLKIIGGKKLNGEVSVAGNKNSTFPVLAAALLANGPTTLHNVPQISDVSTTLKIIRGLGAGVKEYGAGTVVIDPRHLNKFELDPKLSRKIRGSVVFLAPLLARFKKAFLPRLGGDLVGERLITTHTNMLSAFGASVESDHYGCRVELKEFKASNVFLEEASVTATEIGLLLASTSPEETVIEDAAAEPHVSDLAEMLIKMGADISGVGTNTLRIRGSLKLQPVAHTLRPDHIEAATFVIASAVTGGRIKIKGVLPQDLKMPLLYLSKMGVEYEYSSQDELLVKPSKLVAQKKKFQTRPWPGFPTDLMSQLIVLATQTKGTVLCHDWMYEWRIFFVDHLIFMGADITICDPHRVIVTGPSKLYGDTIPSPDIRAGGALVLAALAAKGESIVEHAEVIERGYENFAERLAGLGANISKLVPAE